MTTREHIIEALAKCGPMRPLVLIRLIDGIDHNAAEVGDELAAMLCDGAVVMGADGIVRRGGQTDGE